MARQVLEYEPVALPSTSADTTYFLRNTGEHPIRVAVRSSVPTTNEKDSFPVPPGGDLYPTPESGESIYAWGVTGHSEVVYEVAN